MDFITVWCNVWVIMVVSIFILSVLMFLKAEKRSWAVLADIMLLSVLVSFLVKWTIDYIM